MHAFALLRPTHALFRNREGVQEADDGAVGAREVRSGRLRQDHSGTGMGCSRGGGNLHPSTAEIDFLYCFCVRAILTRMSKGLTFPGAEFFLSSLFLLVLIRIHQPARLED